MSVHLAAPVTEDTQLARRDWNRCEIDEWIGSMIGYSRSADRTFMWVPQLKLGFDCGVVNGRQPPVVLLTHGHSDHSKDVSWCAQREAGSLIYCPEACKRYVERNIRGDIELNCCEDFDPSKMNFKVIGVVPGQQIETSLRGGSVSLEIFQMEHAVPCVGFGILRKKKRLKDEYKGLPGKELGQLRRSGAVLEEFYEEPHVVYMGDTGISVLSSQPRILEYPTVIIECTFLDIFDNGMTKQDYLERCERDGHILWSQLLPYVLKHPETRFILIHFSLRYSTARVHSFFQEEAKMNDLTNVTVFCGEYRENRFK